jgi:uncharacterized protein YhaN
MSSDTYYNYLEETINNKINGVNKKLKFYKNIFKIMEFFFKEASNQLNKKANNKEMKLQKNENSLNELQNKINKLKKKKKSGSGTSGQSSTNIDAIIDELILKLKPIMEKQSNEISIYKDLAEITKNLSELCKFVVDTIDKFKEMDTIFKDILEIIFEVASLIHPLLRQLKINFKIAVNEVEIEFGKNFNKFAIEVIDVAANNLDKEIETKENNKVGPTMDV